MKTLSCILTALLTLPLLTPAADEALSAVDTDRTVERIAFGSCLKNPAGGPIIDRIIDYKPDLFIWLGDNVYIDTRNKPQRFNQVYSKLGANPRVQALRDACPNLAVWDDHDYGADNVGKDYPLKEHSRKVFGTFWDIQEGTPFWHQAGIYRAHEYGPAGKRVQVILLDGRWNLDKKNPAAMDSYLGAEQWAWLAQVLKRPAQLRVICSGVQVVRINTQGKSWEMWGHHPSERKRLFDLIATTRADGVVFISGDMHFAEIHRTTDTGYPLYDITASGMDTVWRTFGKSKGTPERIGENLLAENFATITIDWSKTPGLTLELRDNKGDAVVSHPVPLSDLKF